MLQQNSSLKYRVVLANVCDLSIVFRWRLYFVKIIPKDTVRYLKDLNKIDNI